jgi:hypothetical protein
MRDDSNVKVGTRFRLAEFRSAYPGDDAQGWDVCSTFRGQPSLVRAMVEPYCEAAIVEACRRMRPMTTYHRRRLSGW